MTHRILHVIATYDLPHYLDALVHSLRSLWPESDVLVVDNGSRRPEMLALLQQLQQHDPQIAVRRRGTNNHMQKTGSLYDAYNAGIEHALANGYDAINFLNDDFELLWQAPDYIDTLLDFLAQHPQASIISLLFPRAIGRRNGYLADSGLDVYRLDGARIIDHGLMLTDFIRRTGFRYATRENELPPGLETAGLQAYLARHPMIAAIAWPVTRRNGRVVGHERHPVDGRYFEPLSAAAVAELRNQTSDRLPLMEDWVRPRLATLAPYCVTTPDREWWEASRSNWASGSTRGRFFIDTETPVGPLRRPSLLHLLASLFKPHQPGLFWLWWESHPLSPFVLAQHHLHFKLGLRSWLRDRFTA